MTMELNAMLERIKEVDERDESQIMNELAGEMVQELFYTTEVYNRRTKRMEKKSKLSWAGTKEAGRSKGNIVVDEKPMITDLDDCVRIVVRVTDLARNFTVFGGCHQPKRMKVIDDDKTGACHYEDDPYYFQKGLSKAQRNALQTILPADYMAKCLERFTRLSARPALNKPGDNGDKKLPPPSKTELKAGLAWESVTQEMVSDYPRLERVFWDITKKQPAEMYKELGVSSRADMTVTAWEAFLQLKETCAPPK